jgi:hypothetical protein
MTTTFNAAATKAAGVNATNFEFTFTRLERIAFGPGRITTLGAEPERMGATRARTIFLTIQPTQANGGLL